jgi:hypothetical protein
VLLQERILSMKEWYENQVEGFRWAAKSRTASNQRASLWDSDRDGCAN